VAPLLLEHALIAAPSPLVVILGPTASGKTALSLALAAQFHGEIVNCDSVAIYREFLIGTAKPTPEERALAPHHLFDVLDPTAFTTAGEYARRARPVLGEIAARRALPIVVGGTGLYLRALLEGLFPGPERSEELRARLRSIAGEKSPAYLHRILQRLDPTAASSIHPNDVPKAIRAIEVSLHSRRPMTEQWALGREPLRGFRILRVGLDPARPELYQRINGRVREMFDRGLIGETRDLLAKYGESGRPLSAIGYKQVVELLQGEINREAAVSMVQQAHRNYAKRQMTWFRREPEVRWFPGFGDQTEIQAQARAWLEQNLSPPDGCTSVERSPS